MAGADDFHPVSKHQQANRGAGEIVAVNQGIDQQLFQRHRRNFQLAQRIKATAFLDVVQVALDKGKAALVLLGQSAVDVFAVLVVLVTQRDARKSHRLNHADR